MIIDRETFTEAAVHTKLLSDAFLSVCQKLTRLSGSCVGNEEEWKGVLNAMMAANAEIAAIGTLLSAVLEADKEEHGEGSVGPQ